MLRLRSVNFRRGFQNLSHKTVPLSPAIGARNQVGILSSYRPASLCSLASQFQTRYLELIPRPMAGLKFPMVDPKEDTLCKDNFVQLNHDRWGSEYWPEKKDLQDAERATLALAQSGIFNTVSRIWQINFQTKRGREERLGCGVGNREPRKKTQNSIKKHTATKIFSTSVSHDFLSSGLMALPDHKNHSYKDGSSKKRRIPRICQIFAPLFNIREHNCITELAALEKKLLTPSL